MSSNLLVTGGAGFIGSNFERRVLQQQGDVRVTVLDALTYAGNLANLREVEGNAHFSFEKGDICDAVLVEALLKAGRFDAIVNFAAESHVDRSITGAAPFVRTNVVGTQVLLELARTLKVPRFLQVSTDEVYGSLLEDKPEQKFTEETPLAPNSPYSASKAGADCLVRSYHHTFGLATIITRCSNNYGPFQFPEKMIPLFVTNLMEGKKVSLYGDGGNIRDWLHVDDHCDALWLALTNGKAGEIYNIGGDCEKTNIELTRLLLASMGRDWDASVESAPDRLGHDRRYAIDASKAKRELGWSPKWKLEDGLRSTIAWYAENEKWWRAIKSGEYLKYYEAQYG